MGNRLIYDDLDITWYDFSNAANTFDNQVAWAGGLSVDFGGTVYTDWRLPTTAVETSGFNVTTSEMGHLFYDELGGIASNPISSSLDPDLALFANLQDNFYWSGTEFSADSNNAWAFGFGDGFQGVGSKVSNLFALAVRSGDVAASAPVPEPGTMALMGIGMAGIVFFRKRIKRQLR